MSGCLLRWRAEVSFRGSGGIPHLLRFEIGSIVRWSDIDFEDETIRWRAGHEKTGYGGWRDARTVLNCYGRPGGAQLGQAIRSRRRPRG